MAALPSAGTQQTATKPTIALLFASLDPHAPQQGMLPFPPMGMPGMSPVPPISPIFRANLRILPTRGRGAPRRGSRPTWGVARLVRLGRTGLALALHSLTPPTLRRGSNYLVCLPSLALADGRNLASSNKHNNIPPLAHEQMPSTGLPAQPAPSRAPHGVELHLEWAYSFCPATLTEYSR